MQSRRAAGFTVVEVILVIIVLAILIGITAFIYTSVRRTAVDTAAQSDLKNLSVEMTRAALKDSGNYPEDMPSLSWSPNITAILVRSETINHYRSLSTIQNGVLLSAICEQLIEDNVGKGTDQGGVVRDYISGCGNWNDDSMQITGWETRTYSTPVSEQTLANYAANYTVSNTWHKQAQETAVKNFYNGLIKKFKQSGGTFPVTSFWDYWANSGNGGVMLQPLPTPTKIPGYCAETRSIDYSDIVWHITEKDKLTQGACV